MPLVLACSTLVRALNTILGIKVCAAMQPSAMHSTTDPYPHNEGYIAMYWLLVLLCLFETP